MITRLLQNGAMEMSAGNAANLLVAMGGCHKFYIIGDIAQHDYAIHILPFEEIVFIGYCAKEMYHIVQLPLEGFESALEELASAPIMNAIVTVVDAANDHSIIFGPRGKTTVFAGSKDSAMWFFRDDWEAWNPNDVG